MKTLLSELLQKLTKKQLIEFLEQHPCNSIPEKVTGIVGLKVRFSEKALRKIDHTDKEVYTITSEYLSDFGQVLVTLDRGVHSYSRISTCWLEPINNKEK